MIFIMLMWWRRKPTKELLAQSGKIFEQLTKDGAKSRSILDIR